MDRTWRATLLVAFIAFAAVAGFGVFLGFEIGGALTVGVVVAVAVALLMWGVARRAESFHDPEQLPPVEPGFPGPPEPHDDHDDDAGAHDDEAGA